jgi:hypothetical protein
VSRRAVRLLRLPVFLTVVLACGVVALPAHAEIAIRVYVLVLAAFVLGHLLARLRRSLPEAQPSPVDAALSRKPRPLVRIPELEKLEREVTLGQATAFDLHFRLRPTLRRIASELLYARRGIDLDSSPAAARRALGDETFELVRADREPPLDRFGRGIDLASLGRVVDALEAI